jgi:hypothetical protein
MALLHTHPDASPPAQSCVRTILSGFSSRDANFIDPRDRRLVARGRQVPCT